MVALLLKEGGRLPQSAVTTVDTGRSTGAVASSSSSCTWHVSTPCFASFALPARTRARLVTRRFGPLCNLCPLR